MAKIRWNSGIFTKQKRQRDEKRKGKKQQKTIKYFSTFLKPFFVRQNRNRRKNKREDRPQQNSAQASERGRETKRERERERTKQRNISQVSIILKFWEGVFFKLKSFSKTKTTHKTVHEISDKKSPILPTFNFRLAICKRIIRSFSETLDFLFLFFERFLFNLVISKMFTKDLRVARLIKHIKTNNTAKLWARVEKEKKGKVEKGKSCKKWG